METLRFVRDNARWLAAGFLLTLSSSYGQTFFISIFAGEIQAEFSLSNAAWGGIYMLGTLGSAVVMIWAGVLTDLFRVRTIGSIVLVLLAAACIATALVPSVFWLVPMIFFLRLFGQGMASHVAAVGMARWYVATRGRALSIAALGFGVGQALLPLIFVVLMGYIGWRWSWVVAAILALVAAPIVLILLQEERTPKSVATENQSAGMGNRHWTRTEVLRTPLYWLILPVMLGPPAFGTAFFFLQVHLAEVKGWSHLEMVGLFPIYTVVTTGFMLLSGFAIDRFGTGKMIAIYTLPLALGFVIFSLTSSLLGGAVGIALFAVSSGMQATVPPAFWAEFFGTRHLGSIKALAAAVMVFGSAIGPGLAGLLLDMGISFPTQMLWVAGYMVVATVLAVIGVQRAVSTLPRTAKIDVVGT
ncbi:MFS transporter [Litoreibacter ponti]|uniref:MFS transporter n=1 Tax=Litoreibacter ponti TaxID=1510457 RepID=A0A2T6BPA0_9RHOB|nr:MFS transporter [Litoreibacter ponti]PTX57872.1 MFS transporter [Litoreibacter ponti]